MRHAAMHLSSAASRELILILMLHRKAVLGVGRTSRLRDLHVWLSLPLCFSEMSGLRDRGIAYYKSRLSICKSIRISNVANTPMVQISRTFVVADASLTCPIL